MKPFNDPWIRRSRRFWEGRQTAAPEGLLSGYLLDESPALLGQNRLEGEWAEALRWIQGGGAALDLGCGTGEWLRRLSPLFKAVEGWDFAPSMIRASKKNLRAAGIKNAALYCGRIERRKGRAAFDFIFTGGVLMYLPDAALRSTLKSLRRLARPGARLVFRESVSSGATWMREKLALRPGLLAKRRRASDEDYVAIYRSLEELKGRLAEAGLKARAVVPNRHYKYSDLCEDWMRRLSFLPPEAAARLVWRGRWIFCYPEYFLRMTLGVHRWPIENYWLVCSST